MAYTGVGARRTGCVVGFFVMLVGGVIAFAFMTGHLPVRPFDSTRWKTVSRADDQTRVHMIEHLIWSGKLDGLSRSDVIDLLGPASDSGYFRDRDLVYHLGNQRSLLSLDSEWLVIDLDPRGRVARYEVVSD